MLSQETFLYWIILSLGIHVAALSFFPPPATWTAPRPGPITVDLLYGSGGGDKEQPGEAAGSDGPGNESLAPPTAHKQPVAPAVSDKIEPPAALPSAPEPQEKAVTKPPAPVPVEKPVPEKKPKPAIPSTVPAEEVADIPETPTPAIATDAGNESRDGQATAAQSSSIEGTPSYGPGHGEAKALGPGHGTSGRGSGHGESGGGGIRATPLGYGKNPPMPYPRTARRRGWEGEVLLRVDVSAAGTVTDIQLEKSSGYRILDNTARREVRNWRFSPASHNGKPRADTVLVPVHFKLHQR
jgi:protein TonB